MNNIYVVGAVICNIASSMIVDEQILPDVERNKQKWISEILTKKAREDKAREDKAREDKAREDKAREDKAREDKAREDKAREDIYLRNILQENKILKERLALYEPGTSKSDDDPINY